MQCMIHKYAKTDNDIIRLENVIGLDKISKERSLVLDNMKMEGILIGERGSLKVLNKIVNDSNCNFTPEELSDKFGFSVEQILNGK